MAVRIGIPCVARCAERRDAMCGSARPDQEVLAQAALTSRDGPVGPDLGKAPLQEAEQARVQMAFLEQEIHAGRPALQV